MRNIETVKRIYEAFGRGDVAAILEPLRHDIDWDYSNVSEVPWLRRRQGREEVAGFFQALAEGLEITRFDVKEVFGSPDERVVVVLVDVRARARATGRPIEEDDEIHVWRFDDAGRIVRFRHGVDTFRHVQALAA